MAAMKELTITTHDVLNQSGFIAWLRDELYRAIEIEKDLRAVPDINAATVNQIWRQIGKRSALEAVSDRLGIDVSDLVD